LRANLRLPPPVPNDTMTLNDTSGHPHWPNDHGTQGADVAGGATSARSDVSSRKADARCRGPRPGIHIVSWDGALSFTEIHKSFELTVNAPVVRHDSQTFKKSAGHARQSALPAFRTAGTGWVFGEARAHVMHPEHGSMVVPR
jgi:hypothetical protein